MDKTLKTIIIVGAIVVGVVLILSFIPGLFRGGQGYGYGYGMMGPWMMGGYGGMFLMPILWIAVVGLIIWAVVAAAQRGGESGSTHSSESALETLKRRYARGEINKEEYEQKRKDLI